MGSTYSQMFLSGLFALIFFVLTGAAGCTLKIIGEGDASGNQLLSKLAANYLSLSAAQVYVEAGGTSQMSVTGGVSPFAFSVDPSGAGGTINSLGLYSAPADTTGSDTVRVIDARGDSSTLSITVYAPLTISPSSITIGSSGTLDFLAAGGIAPLVFSLDNDVDAADGVIDPSTGSYVASVSAGGDTVRVTDAIGNMVTADVTVTGGAGACIAGAQTFTSNGTFVVPPNCTQLTVQAWGGGGGGGSSVSGFFGGAGGGAGYAEKIVPTAGGNLFSVLVGQGGKGGRCGFSGGAGGYQGGRGGVVQGNGQNGIGGGAGGSGGTSSGQGGAGGNGRFGGGGGGGGKEDVSEGGGGGGASVFRDAIVDFVIAGGGGGGGTGDASTGGSGGPGCTLNGGNASAGGNGGGGGGGGACLGDSSQNGTGTSPGNAAQAGTAATGGLGVYSSCNSASNGTAGKVIVNYQ